MTALEIPIELYTVETETTSTKVYVIANTSTFNRMLVNSLVRFGQYNHQLHLCYSLYDGAWSAPVWEESHCGRQQGGVGGERAVEGESGATNSDGGFRESIGDGKRLSKCTLPAIPSQDLI